jgi:hypothetical protein
VKRCTKCHESKPLSDFYEMVGMRDGHRNECKACNLADKARRYRANPEKDKERVRRWQQANPEKYAEQRRRARESGRKAATDRRSHLKRKYGITPEDYDRMLEAQGGVCGICERLPREDISFHVDHDHETGEIRGLLCFRCNNALGDFEDDIDRMRKALRYVDRPDAEVVHRARQRIVALKATA